ncbi:MAG TPA: helix-turn-helix domain-containing protein [Nocardioides sp.]
MATESTTTQEPIRRASRGARERVLSAALELFGEHGVSGTSLQMIADRIGVTKAAVYHQFHTKDEIVLAVLAPALESLHRSIEAAEREEQPEARRESMLTALVDLAVGNRRLAAILRADPAAAELARSHPALDVGSRIRNLFVGPDPDIQSEVAGAMVGGALMMIGAAPELERFDDEELTDQLLALARDLLARHAPTNHR